MGRSPVGCRPSSAECRSSLSPGTRAIRWPNGRHHDRAPTVGQVFVTVWCLKSAVTSTSAIRDALPSSDAPDPPTTPPVSTAGRGPGERTPGSSRRQGTGDDVGELREALPGHRPRPRPVPATARKISVKS